MPINKKDRFSILAKVLSSEGGFQ